MRKAEFTAPGDGGLFDRMKERYYAELRAANQTDGKQARAEAVKALG